MWNAIYYIVGMAIALAIGSFIGLSTWDAFSAGAIGMISGTVARKLDFTFHLSPFEMGIFHANRRVLLMLKLWGHPAIVIRVLAAGIQIRQWVTAKQSTYTRIDFYWGRDKMGCPVCRFVLTCAPMDQLEASGRVKYRQLPFGWRFRRAHPSI
jgi:hypothetical protein